MSSLHKKLNKKDEEIYTQEDELMFENKYSELLKQKALLECENLRNSIGK